MINDAAIDHRDADATPINLELLRRNISHYRACCLVISHLNRTVRRHICDFRMRLEQWQQADRNARGGAVDAVEFQPDLGPVQFEKFVIVIVGTMIELHNHVNHLARFSCLSQI